MKVPRRHFNIIREISARLRAEDEVRSARANDSDSKLRGRTHALPHTLEFSMKIPAPAGDRVAHVERRCSCYVRGAEEGDPPPELTLHEVGRAVAAWYGTHHQ